LVPKPLIAEKSDEVYYLLEWFKEKIKNPAFKKECITLLDDTEEEILDLGSEQENFFNNNLLFFNKSEVKKTGEFKILLYIEDVLPSRLSKLFDLKKEMDTIAVFENCKVPVFKNRKRIGKKPLKFDFGNIWHFFGRSNFFLEITNRIFTNKEIDYSFLIRGVVEKIRGQFANNYPTEESSLRGFQLLLYLRRLDILKNFSGGINMGDRSISDIFGRENETNAVKQVELFFEEFSDFFNNNAKKAIFMEGALAQLLLNIQRLPEVMNAQPGKEPFRSKLQGLKLDERVIKGLLPAIQNKLEEYGKNYYKELESVIAEYMIRAGDGWRMSKDEISFYFVLGMNLSYMFKSKKGEETSSGGDVNE
jgi:CRISPR-associated protein Csh1